MVRTTVMLLLAILGHHLIMASGTAAADAPYGRSHGVQVSPMEPSVDGAHHASCFTADTAVKSAPVPLPFDRLLAPVPDDPPGNVVSRGLNVRLPCHPPSVARAFLQVYRI